MGARYLTRGRGGGEVDFDSSLTIATAPGVYPPSEDSHLLLRAVDVRPGERVIELGTGTGFLALHAAEVARVVATDVNPAAVRLARANGLPLAVVRTDLFRGLRGRFDAIVFNPPYLIETIGGTWEERAWQGGTTGEDVILRFLAAAGEPLADDGRVYLLVPSNRDRALGAARERFSLRIAAKRPLFYETLYALELTHPR